MEGAAVAQVCFEHDIPFTIIRTISDDADETSPVSFTQFIEQVASKYSVEIVKNIYRQIQQLISVFFITPPSPCHVLKLCLNGIKQSSPRGASTDSIENANVVCAALSGLVGVRI
jgi:hypothetical protein